MSNKDYSPNAFIIIFEPRDIPLTCQRLYAYGYSWAASRGTVEEILMDKLRDGRPGNYPVVLHLFPKKTLRYSVGISHITEYLLLYLRDQCKSYKI